MKRILLMDDSPIFLDVAGAALRAAGYDVMLASDLASLERVRNERADLVLVDVQMPEAFGEDVALTLRHAYGVEAPIYLLSSLEEAELRERARWAQIEGYITKSIGLEHIVEEVRRILDGAS